MKVGDLVRLKGNWTGYAPDAWKAGKIAIYLGICKDNKAGIANHLFILDGSRRLADPHFLRMLEVVNESR